MDITNLDKMASKKRDDTRHEYTDLGLEPSKKKPKSVNSHTVKQNRTILNPSEKLARNSEFNVYQNHKQLTAKDKLQE